LYAKKLVIYSVFANLYGTAIILFAERNMKSSTMKNAIRLKKNSEIIRCSLIRISNIQKTKRKGIKVFKIKCIKRNRVNLNSHKQQTI